MTSTAGEEEEEEGASRVGVGRVGEDSEDMAVIAGDKQL